MNFGGWNTSSASTSRGAYEVFLSFRGVETRKGFTDFLYTDLVDAGILTFRDSNELRVGEVISPELLKAITESKISIPIFSSGYAFSKWCLLELAHMVECMKMNGQKVFPIFYDVEPFDVRHQTGSYGKAFLRHEKHFDGKTIRGWKEALRAVGELKGWDLNKDTNGHQGELVKKVVSEVLKELKKNSTVVTDNLVGIDHHIEEMMRLLNVESNDVRIVGINGMVGIGKTTIAKVIYNLLSERFECCCFFEDVRETSQQLKGLVSFQNQLISKILKRKCPDIADVDEGTNMIKNKVCRKKVLIVLDDVDQQSQFDVLARKCDWFGSGSRIIVTTRNKAVLKLLEVNWIYEPQVMELDHSLQLFSKHAFRRDFPPKEYDYLSREIISTAAGLPLALVIIGSFLFDEEKAVWEDTLMKLKDIPHDEVYKKLRISYEALTYEQKQIFLDIACLFIGQDKSLASYMWDDCKFYPKKGINVLILKSLVKIGDDNKLRMHDQLRDLGRQIVREENLKEPGERSRLWHHEEAFEMLERRMGTKRVEALCLDLEVDSHSRYFTSEEFGQLPNLRFLRVDYTDLAGDFKHLFSKLRWLHWHGCPGNFVPTNFYLKNLVILDLSHSQITADWEAWTQIKMAKKLKILDLSDCCGLIRTPDFSTFKSLERLILSECQNLVQIDPSIGNLKELKELDISNSSIKKLPDAIGSLINLRELNCSYCCITKLPNAIGRLSSLRILSLQWTQIHSIPMSICNLSCLEVLNLIGCTELQSLPELPLSLTSLRVTCKEVFYDKEWEWSIIDLFPDTYIRKLSKLETLTLYRTTISILPVEISTFSQLKVLEVESCKHLHCIPRLPSSLIQLCIEDCKSVLPDLSNLKNLSNLCFRSIFGLMEIQGLGGLVLLTSLQLYECRGLVKLNGLERLESLRCLVIKECISLERLPDLSNLKKLQNVVIHDCKELIKIEGLNRLESLKYLHMDGCVSIEILADLSNLGMLERLTLSRCEKLAQVGDLSFLKSLELLDVSYCTSMERVPDLSNLKNLKQLKILGWENLTEIQGLKELESLELLDISGCKLIEKLPDLSNLKKLRELILSGCEKLTEIQGNLKSLTVLDISGCKSLQYLSDFSDTDILTDPWEAESPIEYPSKQANGWHGYGRIG